jgi:large subunit ribosomal protein L1
MAGRGKRYEAALGKLNGEDNGRRVMPADEALAKVKETASAKFDETVDVVIRLGVDAKSGEQMVRGVVTLPHGSGKSPRVVAFARGDAAQAAEAAGADFVGAEDLVAKIESGWKDFDVLVATRDMMRVIGRLGKRLGPRMPNPKAGTVGEDIGQIVRDLKSGRVQFRMDKGGVVHAPIGKVSYDLPKLRENLATLMNAVVRARPASAKGQYLRKVAISATMGPSVHVDPSDAQALAESL